jgi:Transposase IS4
MSQRELPPRNRQKRRPWEASEIATPKKRIRKLQTDDEVVDRAAIASAFIPVVAENEYIPDTASQIPPFHHDFILDRPGKSSKSGLTELQFFSLFFTDQVIDILVQNTNSHAEWELQKAIPQPKCPRKWSSTNPTEIRRYLGIRLYFSLHPEPVWDSYWSPEIYRLGQFIGKSRFEQIHRYFTI